MTAAVRIARERDAELIILHSWGVPAVAFPGEYVYPPALVKDLITNAQRNLDDAVTAASKLGVRRVSGRLLDGPAWKAIVDMTKADPAIDLIVIGTHGRTGVRRVLLGSVAEAVVRHAGCSVLTIRSEGELRPFRHLLCPVDFSPESRAAVELAAGVAEAGGKGITLVHVVELPVAWGELRTFDVDLDLSRYARAELDAWTSELAARVKVPVTSRVCVGRPGAELLALLDKDRTIDLVVMGNRGRTGLVRMALGSVAEKIVRHAHGPVLIAHAPRHR